MFLAKLLSAWKKKILFLSPLSSREMAAGHVSDLLLTLDQLQPHWPWGKAHTGAGVCVYVCVCVEHLMWVFTGRGRNKETKKTKHQVSQRHNYSCWCEKTVLNHTDLTTQRCIVHIYFRTRLNLQKHAETRTYIELCFIYRLDSEQTKAWFYLIKNGCCLLWEARWCSW